MNIDINHILQLIELQNDEKILNPFKHRNNNRQDSFPINHHHQTILNRKGELKNFLQWKFWNQINE